MSFKKITFLFSFLLVLFGLFSNVRAEENFLSIKGEHFIIYYETKDDAFWADQVQDQADRYYDKIASMMGYARYQNYWSWDNRAKIIIYSSKERFHEATGQPEWATAGAVRDQFLFRSRVIISYRQHDDFLENVLPHEISHLMLQDFIGAGPNLPIWFDEGVAQLQENSKLSLARQAVKIFLKDNRYINFPDLFVLDVRRVSDVNLVQLFYAESVTVLDFLIKRYGNSSFQELCFEMKNGLDFQSAFKKIYGSSIASTDDFEKKWLRYMQNE